MRNGKPQSQSETERAVRQRVESGGGTVEDIPYPLDQLKEARKKLAAVEIWVKRNREQDEWPDFRDWPELDRILKGGD